MNKKIISIIFILTLILSGCSSNDLDNDNNDKLKVVASFTIIKDMTEQIGQDLVDVYTLVPSGTDPHEYEPKPDDIKAATDSDILLYNGINLEGGENGWFMKMVDTVNKDRELVYNLTEGLQPMYLTDSKGELDINPHAFIDPQVGILMANNLAKALVEQDPANQDFYLENLDLYLGRLKAIDQKYQETINAIPEENRILITSELAFQYMTKRYGLREASVWKIDTEELGTTDQLKALIEYIKQDTPPYLFLESNVDPKPLQQVSEETGVLIYEEYIYADEIGNKGDEVDTYIKFLEHNIRIIGQGLGGK